MGRSWFGLADEETPLAFDASPAVAAEARLVAETEHPLLGNPNIEGIALRYGFFYGPGTWFSPDGDVGRQVRERQFPIIGNGDGVWSWLHIEDAAIATVAAAGQGNPGVYVIANDEPLPVREWLPAFARWLNAPPPPRISVDDVLKTDGGADDNSDASVIFGKGTNLGKPGSANLVLAVENIDAARGDLLARGVDVSEVFHYAAGPFNDTVNNSRVAGRDPEGRSYSSFASFEDPDGNSWLLQEITTRLPGREWKSARATDVATFAELLHETAEHHDHYEKTHAKHNWWDWYAPYLSARQNGSSPQEASAAAHRYMLEKS